ncbi:PBP1A family penicillin-binding protein [Paenibacillus sp. UMB4589-SE434]|uniref:transglycosylase domain-containing protein n=1 Tax=Paenibacillus sp. UMB4589-SE434 TaxID=3046314 RepID=UPI00254CDA6B|nr:PBP1A family penicillin-binding protein [Paenibacillus sp. UMB4589-SE434]MDK8179743.1 PBP1A family penicillin-binding protein [Paenibacillus sp. UMB4589-SE434]
MSTNDKLSRSNRGQRASSTGHTSNSNNSGQRGNGGSGGSGMSKPKKKWSWKKTWWLMFFTTAFAIFCAVGGYLFILLNGERLMKEYKEADMFQMAEASTVFDRKGNEIAKLGHGASNREVVEAGEIPDMLENAFIATEDRRFQEHQGVDLWSIGRAMVKDVMHGSLKEGGSTITQQLAKNMFLTSDKTFFRKATEVSIALALENHYTKDEIITMYLNRIFFGQGAYGVKAASIRYFGESDLSKLKVWQMATLAAMPKAPSRYNPISNPELSKERRKVVLSLMYEEKYITLSEMEEAAAVDYVPLKSNGGNDQTEKGDAAYMAFVDYMVQEAEERTGLTEDELLRGGFSIYTTMDGDAQRAVFKEFSEDDNFEKSKDDIKSQGSMVISDHQNGALMAMVGGRDYVKKGWNRANVKRQPGSAFKPIVSFGPAIESGQWFPWSTLRDDKQCFGNYCPTDLGRNKYVGPIEMTEAFKRSTNLPAVWLLNEIGIKSGTNFAKQLGIELDKGDYNLSIALGGMTRGTTPIEMAEAYNAFANGGYYYPAYTIKQIKDRKNTDVYTYTVPKPERVMSEKTAYYMTQMMQEVVNSGTGKAAKMDRPVAGKTGSTQHSVPGYNGPGNRDLWFVGYTPEWTGSVWMGYDKTDSNHVLVGSSGQPAALFSKVMTQALKGVDSQSFNKPEDVKEDEKPKPPAAVSGLQGSYSENTKSISLTWKAVEGKNVKYSLYRKATADPQFTKILAGIQANEAEDIGVFAGETYTYYVTATSEDKPEESAKSNEAVIKIEAENVEPPPDPVVPPVTDPVDPNVPGGEIDNPNGNNGNNSGGNNGNGNEGNGSNNGNGDSGSVGPETGGTEGPDNGIDNTTSGQSGNGSSIETGGSTSNNTGKHDNQNGKPDKNKERGGQGADSTSFPPAA